MNETDYNARLYEKMKAEQDKYRDWLVHQEPSEILNHTYEWLDGSEEPVPGMIIFFDWDNKGSSGPQDGESDHVGIVERVEDGRVYTVEGNSGDSCRENSYVIGHYEIYGYGVPAY